LLETTGAGRQRVVRVEEELVGGPSLGAYKSAHEDPEVVSEERGGSGYVVREQEGPVGVLVAHCRTPIGVGLP